MSVSSFTSEMPIKTFWNLGSNLAKTWDKRVVKLLPTDTYFVKNDSLISIIQHFRLIFNSSVEFLKYKCYFKIA